MLWRRGHLEWHDRAAEFHENLLFGSKFMGRHKASLSFFMDRLCGLVVNVEDYKHRGTGFDSRAFLRIFLRELGLERGPLSLVIG
jgi:hypothetical protein